MEGIISHFRGGKHTQYTNHMIIHVEGIRRKEDAQKLKNKTVLWKTQTGKVIKGTISNPHGNKGAVRACFDTGMPGQAIGQKVTIT